MKTALFPAVALLVLSVGCGKKAEKANAAECQKACDRVAELKTASNKAKAKGVVHEFDEALEVQERESTKNIAEIKQRLAEPYPAFNPRPFAHLPAKTQREAAERYKWEAEQLKQQRLDAMRKQDELLATAKKNYEDAKARAEADGKRETAEAFKACNDSCVQRPATFAACLQRTQAVEDVQVCERQ